MIIIVVCNCFVIVVKQIKFEIIKKCLSNYFVYVFDCRPMKKRCVALLTKLLDFYRNISQKHLKSLLINMSHPKVVFFNKTIIYSTVRTRICYCL